jgi:hypothetical protein
MSVSHTVVSWIQVIGLVIGLDGFFFLSFSVFGKTSTPWFRSLLPATGMGLGILLWSRTDLMMLDNPWPPAIGWGVAIFFIAWTYFAASIGITFRLKDVDTFADKLVTYSIRGSLVLMTILYVVVLGIIAFLAITGTLHSDDIRSFGFLTAMVLVLWSLISVDLLPRTVTDARLQKIGFLLSALAILTQFIPPVLDLVNISVR